MCMQNYIFLFSAILANVIGQIFMKAGANQLGGIHINGIFDVIKFLFTPYVFMGIATYGVGTIFWIFALSKFDLSFAYPFLSIGYILILIVSYFIFKEDITAYKVCGVVIIIIGLILISQK